MPRTSEMRESKFLKQTDVGTGTLLTISGCEQQNVAMESQKPDLKWVLTFHEHDKPLVLNATNIQLCEQILGSDDTDAWIGKRIVLYTDPTIPYQGKVVGGIRVRAPRKVTGKPAPPPPPDDDIEDEDPVPF